MIKYRIAGSNCAALPYEGWLSPLTYGISSRIGDRTQISSLRMMCPNRLDDAAKKTLTYRSSVQEQYATLYTKEMTVYFGHIFSYLLNSGGRAKVLKRVLNQ